MISYFLSQLGTSRFSCFFTGSSDHMGRTWPNIPFAKGHRNPKVSDFQPHLHVTFQVMFLLIDRLVNLANKCRCLEENARLEVLKKTGHLPQIEDPGKFNDVLLDFLLSPPKSLLWNLHSGAWNLHRPNMLYRLVSFLSWRINNNSNGNIFLTCVDVICGWHAVNTTSCSRYT